MSSDWPILTLNDICIKITDGAHNSPKSVEIGKPMASVKDLTHFGVDLSEARLIAQEEFDKLVKQGCKPEVGDVLIAKDGNSALDTVCTVDEPLDAVLLSSVAILRPNKEKIDSDFLKYYFCSKHVIEYLKGNFISGAAIPRVILKDFKRAEIKVPPLSVQKDISKILKTLDNKIDLNRQANQTLEAIAQAIFKSWFVDFEPSRAKIAAIEASEDPERAAMAAISGKSVDALDELPDETLAQLKATAALFPDKLVESELGEVPAGWEYQAIKDLSSKISKGTTPSKGDMHNADDAETIPFLKVRDISDNGEISRIDLDKIPASVHTGVLKRSILEVNDVLFTIAGTIGRVAVIEEDLANSNCNQAIAFIRLSEPEKYLDICRMNLISKNVQDEVISKVVQGVQANFSLTELGDIRILIPTMALLKEFNQQICVISSKQNLLLSENRNLAEIRDTLLPRLLSGEISVETTQVELEELL